MKIRPFKKKPLPLVTEGDLCLFFVGVGSAFSKIHNQTNLLVTKGDEHVLVDCGIKCPQALWELGCPITDIKKLLITHSHADHIGGLEEVALMGRYLSHRRPTMIISKEYEKMLWDNSLKGGCGYNEEGKLAFDKFFKTIRPEKVADAERELSEVTVGDLNLRIFRTKHIPDSSLTWEASAYSVGVIIDKRILFTSDTRFDPEFFISLDMEYQFETIFHDCQFFKGGVHASLEEIAGYPLELRKKMYLTHYGDNFKDFKVKVKKLGFAGLAEQHVFYCYDEK
ncbi:MAG: MBL fold metallo-hydrolase [Spirochaetales bacterium]|nr:MBL fold metallo-hydrolase [Spirochaetales bacterium]